MTRGTLSRRPLDIIARRGAAAAVALALLIGAGAPAQTLTDAVDDAVSEQVDAEIEDELTSAVEQQVEADVADAVEQQVEAGVADAVEQQVESGVVDAVEQQVESGVVDAVEQQVESGVVGAVEQVVEAGVVDAVEQDLVPGLVGVVDDGLEDVVGGVAGDALDAAGNGAGGLLGQAEDGSSDGQSDGDGSQTFSAGVDAAGRAVESEVWVVLVPDEYRERIEDWGFDILDQLDLAAIGRVLLRVDAPEDRSIVEAALELALDAPGTRVDFNHVYRPEDTDAAPARRDDAAQHGPRSTGADGTAAPARIGLIDTAVAIDHPALVSADIVQRDFVSYAGPRPVAHGTAVASLLVGRSGRLRGGAVGAALRAGNVFFADAEGREAATAMGLVAALEWLASEGVGVVNMSLAGPPNVVLETAIAAVTAREVVVVAAVGNNGPIGEALYPAAYASVLGITAVDSERRVYAYAGRGDHVAFAAPGVEVTVARGGGGYGVESGTSMATPHATAVIARALAGDAARASAEVVEALKAAALDLGERDFDEIFGFGLIQDEAPALAKTSP